MKKLINVLIVFYLASLLLSCANQEKKLKVSGANVNSGDSEQQDSSLSEKNNDNEVVISDETNNDSVTEVSSILLEELLEVGDRVYFEYDKTKFKDNGVETLKRQARFLNANPTLTVTVEGHCDPRGTREYNLALGERRAYSVKNFLISLGVSDNRISVLSYGKEKPQSEGNDEKSWAQSRTAITIINP